MIQGELTPKQRRFVDEYLMDLNATQAAIRAGYSTHTAEQQGARLFGEC
jgi:phage terminase small subunit